MLQHLTRENLHHTNICIGNRAEIVSDIDILISSFSKKNSKTERLVYEFDKFLLKDAQHIFSKHIHKVGENEMQFTVIVFNSSNIETQNSMLKILEEPPKHTYFFFIVPSKKILLPTVLSRAQIFEYKKQIEISKETHTFLGASYAQRLIFVKKMTDDLKTEKITKQDIINFVEKLEKYTHEHKKIKVLKRIIEIKEYMKDRGASIKQLLEYLAVQI